MHITILTFDGFNELDSLIALGIIGFARRPGWQVSIAAPQPRLVSKNGVVMEAHCGLDALRGADAVIVGSGQRTREVVQDPAVMGALQLDPARQLVGAQCSGALILARLGLLRQQPACTDLSTRPWVEDAGVRVHHRPFHARGNVATAGGCLASAYLAGWVIARLAGLDAATEALHYVAPVGEKEAYVERALQHLRPALEGTGEVFSPRASTAA